MLTSLLSPFRSDLAIYVSSEHIYLGTHTKPLAKEATRIALHKSTRRVLAVGNEALDMEGKEPGNIVVERPFKLGMVWHEDSAEACFRYLLKKHTPRKLIPPRVVLCGNCHGHSAKRAFKDALTHAGAREVLLLETTMAAAIGLGIKVEKPEFNIVLHLERDWLEIAVISLAGVAAHCFEPIGFDSLLADIALYANDVLKLEPDLPSLEATVRSNGFSADTNLVGWKAWIDSIEQGKELAAALSPEALAQACAPTLLRIRRAFSQTLLQLPREKRLLVTVAPIHLTGAFSDLRGLPALLSQRLGHNVQSHPNSAQAAYDGAATVLSELDDLTPLANPRAK